AEGIALRERKNMPFILGLCEQFNIPITWAIVGHLFLEACERKNGITHPDIKRLKHFENQYWNFSSGDWFDADPCCNWPDALEWYAPDVIKKIINSKVKHEIACHTFSHINCQQEVCPDGVFENEIQKCKDMAKDHGTVLNSFVFPANLTGHTEILKKEGFSAYRVDKDVFGFPEKDINGLWQIPTTAMICPSSHHGLSLNYHIKKYKRIIERAIRYQRVCHLWFHPSASKEFLEPVLTDLFKFIDSFRNELHITTMGAYADYLENAKL
ncbi:MAG: polysaccharide deacetylase, partial [Candidatus Omnitrophota bacterium]